MVSAGVQSTSQAGVLDHVPVVTAELLTLAEFHRVLAENRELKSSAADFPDVSVPVALESVECLSRVTTAVGGNQQGEHHVVALFYSDGLNPDGRIAGELTHHGIVRTLGFRVGGEHRSDFQRFIAGVLGYQPGVHAGAGGADGEVEPAGAKQGVQIVGGMATATSSLFHGKSPFVFVGCISLRPGVVWYAISIADCVPFVKHFLKILLNFFA